MKRYSVGWDAFDTHAANWTNELLATVERLDFWIRGSHGPSRGHHLEQLLRAALRRRLPSRFQVSTGFICALERDTEDPEHHVERIVSPQFDIIVWDSVSYPAMFSDGDLVVVLPESVGAIIEVTHDLSGKKLREDFDKFDHLYELYTPERQLMRPFTAMVSLESSGADGLAAIRRVMRHIERYYQYDSTISPNLRYGTLRCQFPSLGPRTLPMFVDAVCVVRDGCILSEANLGEGFVRYTGYSHANKVRDGLTRFEGALMRHLATEAARRDGRIEASVDIFRELGRPPQRSSTVTFIVEDSSRLDPGRNITERWEAARTGAEVRNVGVFSTADHTQPMPRPRMWLTDPRELGKWAIERLSKRTVVSGRHELGVRSGRWRAYVTAQDGRSERAESVVAEGMNWLLEGRTGSQQFDDAGVARELERRLDDLLHPQTQTVPLEHGAAPVESGRRRREKT